MKHWLTRDIKRTPDVETLTVFQARYFRAASSVRRLTAVFWDYRGILVVDFLFRGDAVTAECYCGTLERLLKATVLKMPWFLRQGIVILPANTTPLFASDA
jgi:hypothetical protein